LEADLLMVVFRGSERILIVFAATFSIWLGFRLFQELPTVHDSDGALTLPSMKLTLSKVGPGVFFGLFGASALCVSIYMTVTIPLGNDSIPPLKKVRPERIAIMGAGSGDPTALPQAARDIKVLNCLAATDATSLARTDVETAVHKAQIALLRTVWQPEWTEADIDALDRGKAPANVQLAQIVKARDGNCKGDNP
jgi:hypothetical protein